MSERNRKRIERINEQVDITQVLVDYGFQVYAGGGFGQEQQFSCNMHGDGQDSKPSARVYPDTASWYCFACDQSRDAIQTVREKEGIGFMEAMRFLEKRHNLPPMAWDDEDERPAPEHNPFDETYNRSTVMSYDDARRLLQTFLDELARDRDLPFTMLLGFYEGLDLIDYKARKQWEEPQAAKAMSSLRDKVMTRVIEHNRNAV
jgi:hypothetical protein